MIPEASRFPPRSLRVRARRFPRCSEARSFLAVFPGRDEPAFLEDALGGGVFRFRFRLDRRDVRAVKRPVERGGDRFRRVASVLIFF